MAKIEELKHFSSYLEQIARKYDRYNVFDDFLTMIVCCLSMGREEEQYFRAIKSYEKNELDLFCSAFASVIMEMENEPLSDPFGRYFEEHFHNASLGQFFTPEPICNIMAHIISKPDGGKDKDNKLNDPCCGSGRYFLAYAKIDRNTFFVGVDVSEMCCKMTLINLCLNSLQGEVYHMNSLTLVTWRKWLVLCDPYTIIPVIWEIRNEKEQVPKATTAPERKEIKQKIIPKTSIRVNNLFTDFIQI